MGSIQSRGENLFATYLKHWNAQNIQFVAACYAEPCMFISPGGTAMLQERSALEEFLVQLFAGLNENGFSHSTVGEISVSRCNDGMAIMDVSNVRRLKSDGSVLEAIDAHYILKEYDDGWKIAAAVVCEPDWQ